MDRRDKTLYLRTYLGKKFWREEKRAKIWWLSKFDGISGFLFGGDVFITSATNCSCGRTHVINV